MNNTADNDLFVFLKVKWLNLTGKVDKSVRCLCEIFSGLNIPKVVKIGYFDRVDQWIKRWTFWNTAYKTTTRSHTSIISQTPCIGELLQWTARKRLWLHPANLQNGSPDPDHAPFREDFSSAGLLTKFEISRFTRYKAMNGGAKCRKWSGLGQLGVTQGQPQCHHSIQRIRLPIRLNLIETMRLTCTVFKI